MQGPAAPQSHIVAAWGDTVVASSVYKVAMRNILPVQTKQAGLLTTSDLPPSATGLCAVYGYLPRNQRSGSVVTGDANTRASVSRNATR